LYSLYYIFKKKMNKNLCLRERNNDKWKKITRKITQEDGMMTSVTGADSASLLLIEENE